MSSKEDAPTKRSLEKIVCAAGLMISFLAYGLLQERIMTQPYGDGEMFQYSAFLVLNNRVVACISAVIILYMQGETIANVAPMSSYISISLSNTAATFCQYEALKYVSFPTQTLGKCGKTIPVLALGSIIGGKHYGVVDYVIALLVTFGCTVFLMTGDIVGSAAKAAESDSMFGLLLIGGYLSFDGFTSVFQEKLFKQYKISTYNQMLFVNLCSGALSLLGLVATSQFMPALSFSLRHPALQLNAFMLSLCAMMGQVVIYYSIKNFGALFFATVMTVRQVVSMALSSFLYQNPLSLGQWLGAAVVFGALYYQSVQKTHHHHHSKLPQHQTPESTTQNFSGVVVTK